ncbi:MAG: replication-associated recombination protein A [Bavariicoccus seileri]|uniref:Replication-associated recombination protein A n=1 Tax=Bavariicoccus seileri TaxID=549685 RepID=A0A3D4S4V6_9ENTE|nr:replication-associated recombination protein A [Bavariicoccus seileri]HCS93760.1 replication-associated recombination protein A [Bavariicoccus seileri]
MSKPLAYRMRPTNIDEIVGQTHLVGPHKIIRRMVQAKRLQSMILYGPPGIGKTSIASAIAGTTNYAFRQLNAATDTKKDMEAVVAEGRMSGSIILLLDEIHRLNKVKQDYLLPHLESGQVILIGATTENPYISINPAIRSRTEIFELKPLSPADIKTALLRAISDKERGLGHYNLDVDEIALDHFVNAANGDLRGALNALELATLSTEPEKNHEDRIHITIDVAEESLQKKALSHDTNGDAHYDVISAFQKSIRGSDVDAALHYLARLLEAGELTIVCRRLLVVAYEDINFGNPQAVERAVLAVTAAEKLGLPEARIPLANAVIDLSLSPKSNSSIVAIDKALADVREGKSGQVPDHLKDAHYSGAKKLGRGITYKYPHSYPNHYVSQQYLPDTLKKSTYFEPDSIGKYEQALKLQLQKFRKS